MRRLTSSLALLTALLMGCEIVDIERQSVYEVGEQPLSAQLLEDITAGKTSRRWIIDHLGPPDSISESEGKELFLYNFARKQRDDYRFLLLFRYRNERHHLQEVWISLHDNVVERMWMVPELVPPPAVAKGPKSKG